MTEPSDENPTDLNMATCPGCFHPREWNASAVCPICKYRLNADRSAALLPVGTQLKRYVIGEKLGQGGFGITYRGFDSRLHMKVAIKEYYPSDFVGRSVDQKTVVLNAREDEELFGYGLRTFLKEARTLAQLKHPHLVRVLNYFEMNGTAYLVMDYLEGEDLVTHLKRQPDGRLSWRQAIELVLPVLDGLRKVHEAGFMHRDIKPGNLYRTDEGLVLLDFGSARQVTGSHTRSLLIYTKGYAAYEQYFADQLSRQGPWTDVYGVAATLYFMLTAQRPPSALDRKQNDLRQQPDLLGSVRHFVPDLPAAIDAALAPALAVEPEQRLQSIVEFKQRLEAVLVEEETAAQAQSQRQLDLAEEEKTVVYTPPEPDAGRRRRAPMNRHWRVVAVAVVLIGLALGGAWIGYRSPPQRTDISVMPAESPPTLETPPVAKTPAVREATTVTEVAPLKETPPVAQTQPVEQPPPIAETPPVAKTPPIEERPRVALTRQPSELEMVRIPGGCFQMGSPASEKGRSDDERRHQVCVEAFEIGQHEVTVAEFQRFTVATGYRTDAERNAGGEKGCYAWSSTNGKWGWREGVDWRKPGYELSDAHPVVCVSWNDAVAYADWLSKKTERIYRLPTEAQWEYAARAGTTTARYWGDDPDQACQYANIADQTEGPGGHSWAIRHECRDGHWYSVPTGSFQANAWNLSDLLGNVWEWTCSTYDRQYGGAETKCSEEHASDARAVRGGSWFYRPAWARSAKRDRNAPWRRHLDGGFRLVRSS
jgi:formylglycine-generating enzyme required for sulfatase activity/serine/threonine protein kinase